MDSREKPTNLNNARSHQIHGSHHHIKSHGFQSTNQRSCLGCEIERRDFSSKHKHKSHIHIKSHQLKQVTWFSINPMNPSYILWAAAARSLKFQIPYGQSYHHINPKHITTSSQDHITRSTGYITSNHMICSEPSNIFSKYLKT